MRLTQLFQTQTFSTLSSEIRDQYLPTNRDIISYRQNMTVQPPVSAYEPLQETLYHQEDHKYPGGGHSNRHYHE